MNLRLKRICELIKEIAYTEGFHNLGEPVFDRRTNMITWEGNVIDRKIADVRILGRHYGVIAMLPDKSSEEHNKVDWGIFCGDDARMGVLYI